VGHNFTFSFKGVIKIPLKRVSSVIGAIKRAKGGEIKAVGKSIKGSSVFHSGIPSISKILIT